LQALFNDLKANVEQLDKASLEPSSSAGLSILAYSRSVQAKA
jgi:hypothetical protein